MANRTVRKISPSSRPHAAYSLAGKDIDPQTTDLGMRGACDSSYTSQEGLTRWMLLLH